MGWGQEPVGGAMGKGPRAMWTSFAVHRTVTGAPSQSLIMGTITRKKLEAV